MPGGTLMRRGGSWPLGLMVPLVAVGIILAVDVIEGPGTAFVGILAVVPMFAAVFAGPAMTAVVAGSSWLAAVAFGLASPGESGPVQSMRLAIIALVGILAVVASTLRMRQEARLAEAEQKASTVTEIRRISETDELTGVLNRRGVLRSLDATEPLIERTLALIDIDGLKAVNDAHGHQIGDEYITAVARRLSRALAGTDLVGRWGGDEFLIVLEVPVSRSEQVLDRVHAATTAEPVRVFDRLIPVSVSVGVAQWPAGQPLDAALATADEALYEAKLAGRNRTTHPR